MKCRKCGININNGIPVPADDGVNMTVENICINCKNIINRIKEQSKAQNR